jgi:asparagine synthase (glutamine-hydrolysing)
LAFRRLAIIDHSPAGYQPLMSADRRYVIVFNGEIYNYQDLRGELSSHGAVFSSTSDTEVILSATMQWGPVRMLERVWGMFAIALWDHQEPRLMLARDRIGKEPLYYGV